MSTVWPAEPIGATAYTDKAGPGHRIADIPGSWWRKIELHYPDGGLMVLVYDREPDDRMELPELMWRLQLRSGEGWFTITVVNEDGSSNRAEGIQPRT